MPRTFRPLLVLVSVLGLGGCALSTPFTRGVVVPDTAEVVVAVLQKEQVTAMAVQV